MSHLSNDPIYLCSELVSVLYEDHSRNTRTAVANLEEISAAHATLLFDDPPQLGRPVAFAAKAQDLYGVVESIEVDQTLGCYTKVKLDPKSRWQGRLFVPEHFLALCASTSQGEVRRPATIFAKSFTLGER